MPKDVEDKEVKKEIEKIDKAGEVAEAARTAKEKKQAATKKMKATQANKAKVKAAKAADGSEFAQTINRGIYMLTSPYCANNKLTYEDVNKINIGGAIAGMMAFYLPNFDLGHPVVLLVSRIVIFVGKFKQICGKIIGKAKIKSKKEDLREPESDYILDTEQAEEDIEARAAERKEMK